MFRNIFFIRATAMLQ